MSGTRHDARRSDAFTLVEVIVVLVIIGMASAAIFPAVMSMLRSSTRSAAMSTASGEGRLAERLIEHDVRSAIADRSSGDRADLGTAQSSVVDALNATQDTRHDVLRATNTVLTFWSEVIRSSPGPERVTWELRQGTNRPECGETGPSSTQNWCVVRTVVGASRTLSEVVTRGRGAFPATIPNSPCGSTGPRLFCYQLSESASYRWNANWSPNSCTTRWASLNSTFGGGGGWINNVEHNGFDPRVQLHQLDLITEVAVTLPSGGGYGSTGERTFTTTELTIRSRSGEAYRRAIMCGGR